MDHVLLIGDFEPHEGEVAKGTGGCLEMVMANEAVYVTEPEWSGIIIRSRLLAYLPGLSRKKNPRVSMSIIAPYHG